MNVALKKTVSLFFFVLLFVATTFTVTAWLHEDPVQRVEFSLIDQDNELVTNKHLAGRHLVVFFGYTSCPDVCPTQLFKLDQVIKKLAAKGKAAGISPVFISIDPERDSYSAIKSYLSNFHSSFIGLTGSRSQLVNATDSFRTLLQGPPETVDENYLVAHSSLFYIVDQYGRVVENIPFNVSVSQIAEKIEAYM